MKKKQLKSLGIFMGVVLTSFIYTHVDADTLTVPKTADKVIIDSTEHVKYVDSNGVELVAKDGTTYEVSSLSADDITYDEVSAGLLIGEVRRQRQDLFEAMQMYYRIYILKENPADILTGEDE